MQIINQYSMLWTGVVILGVIAYFSLRKGRSVLGVIVVGTTLVIGWLVLRPDQANTKELGQFQAVLGQGQSVLLELQSPY
jgi:hypothetical protein